MHSQERDAPTPPPGRDRERLYEIMSVLRQNGVYKGLTPDKLCAVLEQLGPTYIKIGQLLSTRADILPPSYCSALTRLRSQVAPLPVEDIYQVLAEEHGAAVGEVFKDFGREPLGSASIAQVHTATLTDGTPVVVKVQRPGIRETMTRDMSLLLRAAGLINRSGVAGSTVDFQMVLKEMWRITLQEMDFVQEAAHLENFARLNESVAYVACPRVYRVLTTPQVLVMERIDGLVIDDLDALRGAGYDPHDIGEKLAASFSKQVLDDGFFHADPHSGNLRIREGQIVFLDLGMIGQLRERDRTLLVDGVFAIVNNDVSAVKEVLLAFGASTGSIHHVRLYADLDNLLTRYVSLGMSDINIGELMDELMTLADSHSLTLPEGLSMLGRSLSIVQDLLARLDPELNMFAILSSHLSAGSFRGESLRTRIFSNLRSLLASGEKSLEIPAQASDLLKTTLKGQAKLNIEWTGSEEPMRQLDGIANKLILALLIVGLLISAGLISALPAESTLLGVPLAALALYFAAFVLAAWLAWCMRKQKKRKN